MVVAEREVSMKQKWSGLWLELLGREVGRDAARVGKLGRQVGAHVGGEVVSSKSLDWTRGRL